MYGLVLENLAAFIKIQWGEAKWESVRRHCGIDAPSFSIHHVYAETIIPRLAKSATVVLGVGEREFFEGMGVYFVEFVGQYGYDQVMSVLGRHMRDFLNGLDNLHEYLKFSYPKMRAPSFFCSDETVNGLILHYRSKRRGFIYYSMGQIKQVAKHFYDTDCGIELLSEEMDGETNHVTFQLKFDNRALIQSESLLSLYRDEQQLPVKPGFIFDLFPFCVVFDEDMIIRHIGQSLHTILKDLTGQVVTDAFELVRPLISFTFIHVRERMNNVFELITVAAINEDETFLDLEEEDSGFNLRLKGQMKYMEDWNMILYLASPVMSDLGTLVAAGLYVNDLPLHDCSRDLILAGSQQSVELKLALDQEQQKSHKLEDSMKKLDEEMKKTDELLYQMIPRQVADRIRLGENPVDTCEVYEMVSVLFSDVVTFTEICSRITPMQVVSMLNHMYSLFDQLTERNGVYKVETIGDAYMVVSGAPTKEANHAEKICDMAMDMIDASMGLRDPSNEEEHLKLRVGCHSGTVVAGVVGLKMPRWCLFGDCVNTSSRMETTSEPGRVQISESTKSLLPSPYQYEFRGEVAMKGKGMMSTYWLTGRVGRIPLMQLQCNTFSWAAPSLPQLPGDVSKKTSSISGDSTTSAARLMKEKSMSVSESDGPGRGKMSSAFSIDSSAGHIPTSAHAPALSKMNLDAAKEAVSRALSVAKEERAAVAIAKEEKEKKQEESAAPKPASTPTPTTTPVNKSVPPSTPSPAPPTPAAAPAPPPTPAAAPAPPPQTKTPNPTPNPSFSSPSPPAVAEAAAEQKQNSPATSSTTVTLVKPAESPVANPATGSKVENPSKPIDSEQANCVPVPSLSSETEAENQSQEGNSLNIKATLNNTELNSVEGNTVINSSATNDGKKEGDRRKGYEERKYRPRGRRGFHNN